MAWFTTDEGKHVNTDWFDEDEKRKYRQLEQNQAEAKKMNRDPAVEQAVEKAFRKANLIGEDADLYEVIYSYKALQNLPQDQIEEIYEELSNRLFGSSYDLRAPKTTYNKQGFETGSEIEFSENTWKKMAELRKLGGFEDPELKDLVDSKIYDLVSEYGDLERYDADLTTLRERLDESGITSDEYWTGYHVMADQLKIRAPRYTVMDRSESPWDETFGSAEEARDWASQRDDARYIFDKWTRKKERIGSDIERNADGEILFKAMVTDKETGKRRSMEISAVSVAQAREELKRNGYSVTPRTLLPRKSFERVMNETNAYDWDWEDAQKEFKDELKQSPVSRVAKSKVVANTDQRIATTLSKRGISADWEIEQYFRNLSPQRRSQLAAQMGITSTGDERIREMAMRVFAAAKEF